MQNFTVASLIDAGIEMYFLYIASYEKEAYSASKSFLAQLF